MRIGTAQMCARVARRLGSSLGLRGAGLAQKLRHGSGKLPRRVRLSARVLERAEAQLADPRLAALCDPGLIRPHYRICMRYLSRCNRGAAFRAWFKGIAAQLALAFLAMVVIGAVITQSRGQW
jgi:hypothetical protein